MCVHLLSFLAFTIVEMWISFLQLDFHEKYIKIANNNHAFKWFEWL